MPSFRLSPQQRRRWRLSGREASPSAVVALRLPAGVEESAVRAAVDATVGGHDALRTRFETRAGLKLPVQDVAPTAAVAWWEATEDSLHGLMEAASSPPVEGDGAPVAASVADVAEAGGTDGGAVLLLTVPVASADAWSLGNLAAEVERRLAGDEPGETLQYPKYAGFQNELGDDVEEAEEALAYWRRALAEVPGLRLPLPGAGDPGEAPFRASLEVGVGVDRQALETAAADLGLAATTLTGAAWSGFLARLAGGEATVGHLLPGRDYEVLQPAIGLFARAVPVAVGVEPERGSSFADLAGEVGGSLAAAADVVDHFDLEDHFSGPDDGPPRFDALFETDPRWPSPVRAKRVNQEPFLVRLRHVTAEDGGHRLSLSVDESRLDGETAAVLARDFATFLAAALADPARPWDSLPWMPAVAVERLLAEVYSGPQPDAAPATVVEGIAATAHRDPEGIAVVCEGEVIRRRELERRAGRLAAHLRSLGVGPEAVVGLAMERSADMVVALVAVLGAGGAYLPMEPDLPAARRDTMLRAAGARWLLTHQGLSDDHEAPAPEGGAGAGAAPWEVLDLAAAERVAEGIAESEAAYPSTVPEPESAAYVIFTSGSTGEPKGVVVEHRHLAAYVTALGRRLDLPAGRPHTYGMVSSLAADAGHTSLFSALAGGGPLLLAGTETSVDPTALAARLREHPVDVLKIIPSHLDALLTGGDEAADLLPRERLICGGETLLPRLVRRVRELAPELRVVNHYGPTEATVGNLTFEVERWGAGGIADVLPPEARSVPVGHPLAGCRTYVVDRHGQPVPQGVEGELLLGGRQVARGYRGRPGATAERFVPDPHAEQPGARAYRSGDLARALPPAGAIEFAGRRDDQVKIRGFRVEPAEVARRLEAHPEVRAAHVAARQDEAGRDQLVAWVEGKSGASGGETLPNGLRVDELNRNETRHLYDQIFVDRIYDRYGTVYEDGAVIFDVGANIGMFSLFAALRCKDPRIFAFEPSPYAFARLRRNSERYGLDVELFEAGVADREGTAELTVYPRASVMSGFHADREQEERLFRDAFAAEGHGDDDGQAAELAAGRFEAEVLTRPLTTISAVLRRHGVERVDLLKLDAEKSELEVLEGIEEADWPKIRQLLLEVHDLGDRVERIRRLLTDHGYRVVVEEDPDLAGTGIFHVHASRLPAREAAPPPLAVPPPVAELSPQGLEDHLRRTLPDAMVPAHFVLLERLPLTRNGKVDRAALPDPEQAADAAYVPPSNAVEKALADIWARVLGRPRVGVEDNFFELGGDSILSIQVAAQARQAGLRLATRLLFQHQTIRELAAVAEQVAAETVDAEQGPVTGPVPATPIQRWFHEQGFADAHHFNQSVLLTVRQPLEDGALRATVARLVGHHDALRLRLRLAADGAAEGGVPDQEIVADAATPFTVVDLSALPAARRTDAVSAAAAAQQRSLHLGNGPLLRVCHFDLGAGEPGRLLLIVHHLVMDGVSWRILLADLQAAYAGLASDGRAALPRKTTSFAAWARRLERHAGEDEVLAEVDFWRRQEAPADAGGGREEASTAAARAVSTHLDEETTGALLGEVPGAYQVQVPEVLVAALAGAFRRVEGRRELGVVLEGHGREDLFEGVDLSRTLGWFTTHYPVRLEAPSTEAPGDLLKRVKEALRAVPRGGIGFGLLRHLAPASPAVAALRDQAVPGLKFNYLGRFDQVLPADSPFAPAFEDKGRDRSPRAHRPYPLEVDAMVSEGRLQVAWTFEPAALPRQRAEALADAYLAELRALVDHCLSGDDAGYTPSDFPLADLDQSLLDEALLEADFEIRGDS